jgi:hypothetical protein
VPDTQFSLLVVLASQRLSTVDGERLPVAFDPPFDGPFD